MKEITLEELRIALREYEPVKFSYIKNDGTERIALGTLNPELIAEDLKPKNNLDPSTYSNLRYYDLEKNGWRSLSHECSSIKLI